MANGGAWGKLNATLRNGEWQAGEVFALFMHHVTLGKVKVKDDDVTNGSFRRRRPTSFFSHADHRHSPVFLLVIPCYCCNCTSPIDSRSWYCTVVGVGKGICNLHYVGIKMMRGLLFLLCLCFSVSATMTSTSNENKEVRLIR